MPDLKVPVYYHIIALFLKRAQSYLMFIFGVKEEPSLKVIFFTVLVRKNQSGFDLTIKIKWFQNKKGQKNLRYPTKKQSFSKEKDCFFSGTSNFLIASTSAH